MPGLVDDSHCSPADHLQHFVSGQLGEYGMRGETPVQGFRCQLLGQHTALMEQFPDRLRIVR